MKQQYRDNSGESAEDIVLESLFESLREDTLITPVMLGNDEPDNIRVELPIRDGKGSNVKVWVQEAEGGYIVKDGGILNRIGKPISKAEKIAEDNNVIVKKHEYGYRELIYKVEKYRLGDGIIHMVNVILQITNLKT